MTELAGALRSGEVALTDFINQLCTHIEATEPELQALLPEPARRARLLADAGVLVAQYPEPSQRPPLFGVPVGVKDIFHADGFVTRAGSELPPELFAGPEATVVTKLKQHGALILGKTVATEFAFADPGPTRNPHNLKHTPGGSSSGSAAAVAAGYCPLALGTQTIGSIGRPASYCGVVGFKPSCGRIATDGCIPFSHSADHIGFFVPALSDVALVAPLLCDGWNSADEAPPVALTIGVPSGAYLDQAEPGMRVLFDCVLKELAGKGHEMVLVDLFPDWAGTVETHYDLIGAEMAAFHRPWFDKHRDRYRKGSRELIERGLSVSGERIKQARAGQAQLRDLIHARMQDRSMDCLLTPSATGPAPEGLDFTGNPRMNLPWSYTGLPTLTVPAGVSDKGLPMGIQWVGKFGAESQLLRMLADNAPCRSAEK